MPVKLHLLRVAVRVDLALPLPAAGLDPELERLALEDGLDVPVGGGGRSGHVEALGGERTSEGWEWLSKARSSMLSVKSIRSRAERILSRDCLG